VDGDANDLALTEGENLKETIRYLGIAPAQPPAVADAGDHLLLVGVDHLFDLGMEVLERLPVVAQDFSRGVETR
jgi:hypothetical protein